MWCWGEDDSEETLGWTVILKHRSGTVCLILDHLWKVHPVV
jgi:hypothetical protein